MTRAQRELMFSLMDTLTARWASTTAESRRKGDKGILAALRAAHLAEGLFGIAHLREWNGLLNGATLGSCGDDHERDGVNQGHPLLSLQSSKWLHSATSAHARRLASHCTTGKDATTVRLTSNPSSNVMTAAAQRDPFSPHQIILSELLLGPEQEDEEAPAVCVRSDKERDAMKREVSAAWAALSRAAVGIPSNPLSSDYMQIRDFVEYVRPISPLNEEDARKLLLMLSIARGSRVRVLDLTGRLRRAEIAPPATEHYSSKLKEVRLTYPPHLSRAEQEADFCVASVVSERLRRDLAAQGAQGQPPTAQTGGSNTITAAQPLRALGRAVKGARGTSGGGDEEDDDEGEESDAEEAEGDDDSEASRKNGSAKKVKKHNAQLKREFERLFPDREYPGYEDAIRQVALQQLNAIQVVFNALAHTNGNSTALQRNMIHTVYLDDNRLGAPVMKSQSPPKAGDNSAQSEKEDGILQDWGPLYLLAHAVSANETLGVLSLRNNDLGPKGAGIIAKAMTRNTSIHSLDLASNHLMGYRRGEQLHVEGGVGFNARIAAEAAEELEVVGGPVEAWERDPVYGEELSGLVALSELLKKNRALRSLSLRDNGIHSGPESGGAEPPEESDDGAGSFVQLFEDFSSATDSVHFASAGGRKKVHSKVSGAKALLKKLDGKKRSELVMWQDEEGAWMQRPLRFLATEQLEEWEECPLWKFLSPLQHFHHLVSLDISGNHLGARGARMIGNALNTNRSVRMLDVSDNAIGARGLFHLATLVIASPVCVVETLVAQHNNIRGKPTSRAQQRAVLYAMQALAQAIQAKYRWCMSNEVRGDEAARGAPLRRLLLAGNHLGSEHVATLLATILPGTPVDAWLTDNAEGSTPKNGTIESRGSGLSSPSTESSTFGVDVLQGQSPSSMSSLRGPFTFCGCVGLVELDLERNEACGEHPAVFDGTCASYLHAALTSPPPIGSPSSGRGVLPSWRSSSALRSGAGDHRHANQGLEPGASGSASDAPRQPVSSVARPPLVDSIDERPGDGDGPQRSTLEVLSLSGNNIQARGARILFGSLVSPAPGVPTGVSAYYALRVLDLSRNSLGNDGMEVVAFAAKQIPTLREINLAYNEISACPALSELLCVPSDADDSVASVAQPQLRRLNLSHNYLGTESPALRETGNLPPAPTEVVGPMAGEGGSPLGNFPNFTTVFKLLMAHPTLTHVDLSFNGWTTVHGEIIATTLEETSTSSSGPNCIDLRDPNEPFAMSSAIGILQWLKTRKGIESFRMSCAFQGVVNGVEHSDQRPVWDATRQAVYENESLVELDCGLVLPADLDLGPEEGRGSWAGRTVSNRGTAASTEEAKYWEDLVGVMRGRLLLNAMVKGPRPPEAF